MKHRKNGLLGCAAAALLAGIGLAAAQPPGMKMPAMPVQLSEVRQQEVQKKIWYSGHLLSRHRANLAAESVGRLLEVAEVGDTLMAGAEVARFDDALLRQDLAEQEAAVRSHQARSEFLRREVARLTELAAGDNAAQSQLESVQADLSAALSARDAARARTARLREELRRMRIAAPFPGVVSERFAEPGEWLAPGDPVVRLVNTTDLEITTSVSERLLPYLDIGSVLEVDAGGRSHQARIRTVVPVGDSRSRLFELRLVPFGDFGRAQQLVRVAVPVASPRQGMVVPEDALVIRHDGARIFVISEDLRARGVPVDVGLSDRGGLVEVRGELRPGDKVVVRGNERLRDGMEVRPVAPAGLRRPAETVPVPR